MEQLSPVSSDFEFDTGSGHGAFTEIKTQLITLDENIKTVISAIPSAIADGLPESLAEEAKSYLTELQELSAKMQTTHLKAHVKFRDGIKQSPKGSNFSGRAPT